MSFNNTTVNITVRDSTHKLVVGASVVISVAGKIYNLVTDATGIAVTSLSLTNITVGTITISAIGYLPLQKTYVISPAFNVYSEVISIDPSQINKSVQFLDIDNQPVSNLLISVNGNLIGKTSSSGHIQVVSSAGETTIQATGIGYLPKTVSGIYTASDFPNQIVISTAVISSQILSLQSLPFANINITGNNLSDNLTTDSTGIGTTNISFPPGIYNLTVTKSGFTTSYSILTVLKNVPTYAIAPLQSTGLPINPGGRHFGITNTTSFSSTSSSTQVNSGANTELEYPAEWVYPNSGEGRYFTGTQGRIYVGNLFVDEVDTLYSVYNNNRIPIYGYSSANVDAFGQGRRLVQGQISLNFVSEGYLYTLLNEYQKKNADANLNPAEQAANTATASLAALYQQQAALITQQSNGDSSQATATQLTSVTNQITSALSSSTPGTITQVKQVLANATSVNTNQNAVKLNIPFDIVLNASAGGRTTTRKIKNCLLTTNEQVWDQSDNVIKDVYGFVAVEMI